MMFPFLIGKVLTSLIKKVFLVYFAQKEFPFLIGKVLTMA